MNTLRVGVLMGGRGNEREVSLNSGRTICDHLDTSRYSIVPLFQRLDGALFLLPWRFLHRGKTSDFEHRLESEAEKITWDSLKERIDFMYSAMHGRYAEDGTLQGFLEVLGIPYLGSKVLASALGMDKIMQKKMLRQRGIHVPKDRVLQPNEIAAYANNPIELLSTLSRIGYPCVVKPQKEGSSMGVSVVHGEDELIPSLQRASAIDPHKAQAVLIEEYITGMEFSCIAIMDTAGKWRALPATEIVCDESTLFFDYEQKYMPGKSTKFTPARCSQETLSAIQETAIRVSTILGFKTIARIDGFVTPQGTIVITDPNSLAGMAPSSFVFRQAAEIGMSHACFINHLIETELSQYGMLSDILKREKQEQLTMNKTAKKRIGVLLGGRNHEKEVSLDSGRNIVYKLTSDAYEPIPLFVSDTLELYAIDHSLLVRNSTKEIAHGLRPEMKVLWNDLPSLVDFVFIGLHGDVGENGSVQGTLEMLNIPYNGSSVLTSALCMDKYATGQFLKGEGFEVPHQYLVAKDRWFADQSSELSIVSQQFSTLPVIIKPHDDGCSVMVTKAHTLDELARAITTIFNDGKEYALVEEFLVGMELTVGVIGNTTAQALPPSQALSSQSILSMEEKFLPGAGENQTPAPLQATTLTFIQRTLERAYKALDCKGYVRIDCFYQSAQKSPTKEERLVILEVNSLPALTPATCIFHQAAEIGLTPSEFIKLIVELGDEEHNRRGTVVATNISHSPTSMAMNPPALEKV
jgi:UDP-N-acetylmuramate--alanine ligase